MTSKSDMEMVIAIRAKKKALIEKAAAELRTLDEAERVFGGDDVERDGDDHPVASILRLHGQPTWKAAEWALNELAETVKLSEIVDLLIKNNYAERAEKKTLTNTVYVAMSRSKRFQQFADGTWGLTVWDGDGDVGKDEEEVFV